jgi:hypothetical protein
MPNTTGKLDFKEYKISQSDFSSMIMKYFLAIVLFICSVSCNKSSNPTSDKGTFTLTTTAGKTFSFNYVNIPTPVANGTFSAQIQQTTNNNRWQFIIYVDNNNELAFDIIMSKAIVNGTTYTTATSQSVNLYGKLDNASLNLTKTEVVFEKSTYPGQLKATFKGYRANNVLYCNGQFDFIAK